MASLFSALVASVTGLTAQSEAIGNVSDNLANSQTTGFKSIGTEFEDLVTQSNAGVNNPGGVRATPQYQNDVQGNLVQSNTATSLAISGQGYFAVDAATVGSTGVTTFSGSPLYTRQGDFTLNKEGYLVNGSGYYLTGWNIDSSGNVDTATTQPIQISALFNNPVPSTTSTYTANLPSSSATTFVSTPSTVQLYDALGNTHDMTFTWTHTAASDWSLTVDVAGGGGVDSSGNPVDYKATIPFVFNDTTDPGTLKSITASSATPAAYTTTAPATDPTAANLNFNLKFGNTSQAMTVSFGHYNESDGLTQFADSNVSVSNFAQNGLPKGSFSSLSIDANGFVSLNYNNGTQKSVAQIPIVQFNAQDQLQRVTGGAYQATLASGSGNYSAAGASGAGTIVGSSLESSNVDIATQFTDMIQAQQIYSANAKAITTINQMLSTIIQTVQ